MNPELDGAFLDRLSQALRDPLPGSAAHRPVTPELAYGRHRGPARNSNNLSAVLLALVLRDGGWSIPLTLRASHLPSHGGQISFPGGRLENGEEPWIAAKREFHEELGATAEQFVLLGQLTPLQVFASRHWVVPFVAACHEPMRYHPNLNEVESVFEMSIKHLMTVNFSERNTQRRGLLHFETPGFAFQSHFIWGATAMILNEFKCVLEKVLSKNS